MFQGKIASSDSTSIFGIIDIMECMKIATIKIYATPLTLQVPQTRLERYPLCKDPVLSLAKLFTFENVPTPSWCTIREMTPS